MWRRSLHLAMQAAGLLCAAALPCAAETTLFSTLPGVAASPAGVNSQRYPNLGNFETRGADDFTVVQSGASRGWYVQRIEARGRFVAQPQNPVPPAGVNLALFENSAGLPNTVALGSALLFEPLLPFTEPQGGTLSIPLPDGGIFLEPGTYWLMVQPDMSLNTSGQWLWTESASAQGSGVPSGAPSAWMQTAPTLGLGCVNEWGARIEDCSQEGNPGTLPISPDFAFAIHGEQAVPGVTITPTSGLVTRETPESAQFTVVLDAPPTANVSLSFTSVDTTEGTMQGFGNLLTLTFTPENWNVPQTAQVNGVDDALQDGDVTYLVDSSITISNDPGYGGLVVDNIVLTNMDNDTPGFEVTPVSGVVLTENGPSVEFSIKPLLPPTQTVSLGISTTDPSEGNPIFSNLFFTAGLTQPKIVTITPADDDIDDGDKAFTIVTGDPVSADPAYDALDANDVDDVSVTCVDDDTSGFTINVPGGEPLLTNEDGDQGSFSVVLKCQPFANVTLTLVTTTPSEGQVLPTSLLFTAANWDEPQFAEVTGQDDVAQDGDVEYAIGVVPSSPDANYNLLPSGAVSCLNEDNEPPILDPIHSADENADGQMNLSELLRVVQFYNAEIFHCDETKPDGYAPGIGDADCDPHDADYATPLWQISLSELLRMVQLFALGEYEPCAEGESDDGFCSA